MTPLTWESLYNEVELYKAAVRLYTKPLFTWRKALGTSSDQKTLYDFARHGLQNLNALHRSLSERRFRFRNGRALHYNFNGKKRTLYVYPWEERLVDLLLYRLLNHRLHHWFSPHSYAYREGRLGIDTCQRRLAALLRGPGVFYVMKRDISDYFASVDHDILLDRLQVLVDPQDYLYQLLRQRVEFGYLEGVEPRIADVGIPFGTAIACLFANIYLTDLDRRMVAVEGLHYFRYADDLCAVSIKREAVLEAARVYDSCVQELKLKSNPRHHLNIALSEQPTIDPEFLCRTKFRHLGLEFRADGSVGLSRDKFRKICNLFRFAFRRRNASLRRSADPRKRAQLAIHYANKAIEQGVRNVAIIDYYLKHVNDEAQLRLLDRWLAEEVLSLSIGKGHRKGHFKVISFAELRAMGLPSLLHRRRRILRGDVDSPFFIWKSHQMSRGFKGAAAIPTEKEGFSPIPEAAVEQRLVGESDRL